MRANTTQKAYDEAFLACSTAVYFEGEVGFQFRWEQLISEIVLTIRCKEQRERGTPILENGPRPYLLS